MNRFGERHLLGCLAVRSCAATPGYIYIPTGGEVGVGIDGVPMPATGYSLPPAQGFAYLFDGHDLAARRRWNQDSHWRTGILATYRSSPPTRIRTRHANFSVRC